MTVEQKKLAGKLLMLGVNGAGLAVFTFFVACFVLTFFRGFGRSFVEAASSVALVVVGIWGMWVCSRWRRPPAGDSPESAAVSVPWYRRRFGWHGLINLSAAVFLLFWLIAWLVFTGSFERGTLARLDAESVPAEIIALTPPGAKEIVFLKRSGPSGFCRWHCRVTEPEFLAFATERSWKLGDAQKKSFPVLWLERMPDSFWSWSEERPDGESACLVYDRTGEVLYGFVGSGVERQTKKERGE